MRSQVSKMGSLREDRPELFDGNHPRELFDAYVEKYPDVTITFEELMDAIAESMRRAN